MNIAEYFDNILEKISRTSYYLILPLGLYLLSTLGLIYTMKPNNDEFIQTNASVNLVTHGALAFPNMAPMDNPRWTRIDKHFYAQPPLALLLEAAWFKIIGIGLFRMRFLPLLFGLAGLFMWYIILSKLGLNKKIILLAAILISTDFIYTRHATNGRLFDIVCSFFAFAAWASYLSYREKFLPFAILISNTLIVMSGLSHPNGILGFAGLIFLMFYYDFKNLKISYVLIFLAPYLIGGFLWGYYIMQDLDAFKNQFFGYKFIDIADNTGKINFITQTWNLFYSELRWRYLYSYGFGSDFPQTANILVLIFIVYIFSFLYTGVRLKKDKLLRPVFFLTLIYFLLLTFLAKYKWPSYLSHIIPLYTACTAISLNKFENNKISKQLFTLSIILMIIISSSANIYRIKRNDYNKVFLPDIQSMKLIIPENCKLIAPLEVSFQFGFDNVTSDHTLDYSKKSKLAFIMTDSNFESAFERFKKNEPEVYKHTQKTLTKSYTLVFTGNLYKLFKRNN